MIADSVRSSYPAASRVSVDLATIRFSDSAKGLRYTFLTPRTAQVALVNYDRGIKPTPFDFELRGPHITRAGSRHTPRATLTEAQKKGYEKRGTKGVEKARDVLRKTGLRASNKGPLQFNDKIPDRVGGQTPPLQQSKTSKGNIPFTRRRAYGLRALDM
jgi:hypothetical protein